MSTIAPIRVRPACVTPDKVSQIVARCPACTRCVAAAHLEATYGDVEAAIESWLEDHQHLIERAHYVRHHGSLEASE